MPKKPTPDNIARQARDLIEQLNHATIDQSNRATVGPNDLTAPQISATIQALLSLVQHLPQAIEQLGWALDKQAQADNIRMDNGDEPAAPVREVHSGFADAIVHLGRAAQRLQHAASPLFSMAAKH